MVYLVWVPLFCSKQSMADDRHKEIEAYLKSEKALFDAQQREPKILILGSSDSGKSTLVKQMKILHGNSFSKEEVSPSFRFYF